MYYIYHPSMDNTEIYNKAKKKVKKKKQFFYDLIAYLGIMTLLYIIMRFKNGGQYLPVYIVGLCWGIGLLSHYFHVFGTEHLGGFGINPNWEEEELEKEIDRLTYQRELKEQLAKEQSLLEDLERLELKELKKNN